VPEDLTVTLRWGELQLGLAGGRQDQGRRRVRHQRDDLRDEVGDAARPVQLGLRQCRRGIELQGDGETAVVHRLNCEVAVSVSQANV
jgi:hypothetical protein